MKKSWKCGGKTHNKKNKKPGQMLKTCQRRTQKVKQYETSKSVLLGTERINGAKLGDNEYRQPGTILEFKDGRDILTEIE